jgi:uncharacterized protein (TIGR02246 family)
MHQTKRVPLIFLLFFLGISVAWALVVRFHRKENAPEKSPTESAKTQQPDSRSGADREPTAREPNVEMPNATAAKLVRAWNRGSSQEIANLFTPDGILAIPNGSEIQSKSEIEKTIAEKRGGLLRETTLSNTVDEVSQLDADTAVVRGRYQLDGIKILGFSTGATGTFILRQLKREGKWLISKAEVKTGGDG